MRTKDILSNSKHQKSSCASSFTVQKARCVSKEDEISTCGEVMAGGRRRDLRSAETRTASIPFGEFIKKNIR